MTACKTWWAAAGVRALKTFAQVLVATIPATAIINANVNWNGVGWQFATILGTAGLAALLSLLTSVAGLPEVKDPADPMCIPTP